MRADPAAVAAVVQSRWDEEAARFAAAIAPFGLHPEQALADRAAIEATIGDDPVANEAYGALLGVIDAAAATGVAGRLLRRFPS